MQKIREHKMLNIIFKFRRIIFSIWVVFYFENLNAFVLNFVYKFKIYFTH